MITDGTISIWLWTLHHNDTNIFDYVYCCNPWNSCGHSRPVSVYFHHKQKPMSNMTIETWIYSSLNVVMFDFFSDQFVCYYESILVLFVACHIAFFLVWVVLESTAYVLHTVVQLRKYKLCTVLPIWWTPRPINDSCDRFHGFGESFLYVNFTWCASDAL